MRRDWFSDVETFLNVRAANVNVQISANETQGMAVGECLFGKTWSKVRSKGAQEDESKTISSDSTYFM